VALKKGKKASKARSRVDMKVESRALCHGNEKKKKGTGGETGRKGVVKWGQKKKEKKNQPYQASPKARGGAEQRKAQVKGKGAISTGKRVTILPGVWRREKMPGK